MVKYARMTVIMVNTVTQLKVLMYNILGAETSLICIDIDLYYMITMAIQLRGTNKVLVFVCFRLQADNIE